MNHRSYAPHHQIPWQQDLCSSCKNLWSLTDLDYTTFIDHTVLFLVPYLQLLNDQHGLTVISSPHPALIYAWGWPHTTASLNGLFGLWMYLSVKDAVSDLPRSPFWWHIAASTCNYLPESLPSSCKSTGQSRSSESICPGEAIGQ